MADEADSRHTTPTQRWGETAAEVPNATNVVEPSGGKKDVGWVPAVDGIVGEWWNWLHWSAGVFARYVENLLGLGLVRNHVAAGAAAGECLVTIGAGLSVNVAQGRVMIGGAMYKVPAAVNLALAAADPTNTRYDLIVARIVSLAPVYARITGTPSATPAVPAAAAGDVEVGYAVVLATGVVPNQVLDLREFGAVAVDRVIANDRIDAAAIGGGDHAFRVVTVGTASTTYLGNTDDPQILIRPFAAPAVQVKAASVGFVAAITCRENLDSSDFREPSAGINSGNMIYAGPTTGGGVYGSTPTLGDILAASVNIPKGRTIKAARVSGTRINATDGWHLRFYSVNSNSGAATLLGEAANAGTGIAGGFILSVSGLLEVATEGARYVLEVEREGAVDIVRLYSGEVEYTEVYPHATI